MMKKTLVATAAILSLGSAFAQSNVTLYGVIDTAFQSQNNQTATGGSLTSIGSGAISGSRFGFKGTEDLGGGNNALFQLEGGFNPANGASGQGGLMFGRQAFMGLSGSWGKFTVGRQYDQLFEMLGNFDPLWGISNANNTGFYLAYDGAGVRVNSSARYGFAAGGFNGAVMYGTGGIAGASSAGSYKGLNASYTAGPLNVGGAWQSKDLNTSATTALGTQSNSLIGANYGFGPARVFFNYQTTKFSTNSNTSKITTLGLNYDITPTVGLVAAYYNDKVSAATSSKRNTFGLGVTYSLSKRTMVYGYLDTTKADAAYAISPAAIPGTTQNTYMVGLRHGF